MKLADNNHRISPITSNSTSPTSYLQGMKAAFYTLGCKLNFAETSALGDQLEMEGVEKAQKGEIADICIINTCSVTETSEHKCRQTIHKAIREHPGAFVMVTGCYAQLAAEKLASIAGVDLVLGTEQKGQILSILKEKLPLHLSSTADHDHSLHEAIAAPYNDIRSFAHSCSRGERTRYFLKVQDGCNQFCSYCIIPYTRGRIRSRAIDDVTAEIKRIAQNGTKEVVLTGIHLSSYGKDFDNGENLLHLIQTVHQIEGIERIRLGSLEPRIITRDFAEELNKLEKFCPHFHLSLQSGCEATLKRMNRHYTPGEYYEKCKLLREVFDHPAITTDVIVGFPGETEQEFEQTREFLEQVHFYEMHIFKYSKRKGTRAAVMPDQVPEQIKTERSNRLLELDGALSREYREFWIGKEVTVLLEEEVTFDQTSYMVGHTKEYVKAAVKTTAPSNTLITGKVSRFLNNETVIIENVLAE